MKTKQNKKKRKYKRELIGTRMQEVGSKPPNDLPILPKKANAILDFSHSIMIALNDFVTYTDLQLSVESIPVFAGSPYLIYEYYSI